MFKHFISLVLLGVVILFAQTVINEGQIMTANWTKSASPYHIYGNLEIPYGEKLTIDSGVQVIFYGHYWINVQGAIIAKGKSDDMIVFDSCDGNTKWFGIRFIYTSNSSPMSVIEYCHLSNAAAIYEYEPADPDPANLMHGGAIYFRQFDKARVVNCIIENNIAATGGGIGIRESSPIIKDNIIRNNISQGPSSAWGAGIAITLGSYPMVKGNTIEYNTCIGNQNYCGGSGIYLDGESDAHIQNNIVRFNSINPYKGLKAPSFDGAAFYIHNSNPKIIGNLVYDNTNNMLDGGGFWMIWCDSYFINNTIKSNRAASSGGGFFLRYSDPVFHNNIIRYNEAVESGEQFYLDDSDCDPDFYNNNIQGGLEAFSGSGSYDFTGAWVNNYDEDPKYVGGTKDYSYELSSDSPCIDNGESVIPGFEFSLAIDINNNERICPVTKSGIDMGAYEYSSNAYQIEVPVISSSEVSQGSITLNWAEVPNTLYYSVFSSDDNMNFEEDFSGSFMGCTWSAPVNASRKFYRVIAVN